MEFGIFSNGERHNAIAADSYDEDLYEVKLVDRLGFREAWISEHLRGLGQTRPDAIEGGAIGKQRVQQHQIAPLADLHDVERGIVGGHSRGLITKSR